MAERGGWLVTIEARGDGAVDESSLHDMCAELEAHDPAINGGEGRYQATFRIFGSYPPEKAVMVGVHTFRRASRASELPEWPVTRAEVVAAFNGFAGEPGVDQGRALQEQSA